MVVGCPPGGTPVKKSFSCGAVIAGCPAVFVGDDDDAILRQVVAHAAAAHGIDSPPPEVASAVLASIASVPEYLVDAFEQLRSALPAQREPLEPQVRPTSAGPASTASSRAADHSADLMRRVFEDAPTAVAVTSADGRFDHVNQALADLVHIPAPELAGTEIERLVHPDDLPAVLAVRAEMLSGRLSRSQMVVRLIRDDASEISVEMTCAPLFGGPNRAGQIISHLQDVTDRRAEQERLTRAAQTDPLTGLPNRAFLFEQLELALARRNRRDQTVTLLFCDIDDFKSVNDTYGHHVGDAVLAEYAERLRNVKRPGDLAARFAGDEFVLVYENGPLLDTAALVDRLHDVLSQPFAVDEALISLTTSIGTAVASREQVTAIDLLRHADRAMYGVKAQRRRIR